VKKTWLILSVGLACGWLSLSCGPCKSTSLIIQADTAIHKAKTAEADTKSPYEYTAAIQYLHKAREKWGTSDFEYAIDYATKAQDLATQAFDQSLNKQPLEK
jgi:hypothetical protein